MTDASKFFEIVAPEVAFSTQKYNVTFTVIICVFVYVVPFRSFCSALHTWAWAEPSLRACSSSPLANIVTLPVRVVFPPLDALSDVVLRLRPSMCPHPAALWRAVFSGAAWWRIR
jgi:hypothetical protein